VRHGQSVWNVTDPSQNLVSRFTGWTNVDLSKRGVLQAHAAGRALRDYRDETGEPLRVDSAFCSLLVRAERTLDIMATEMRLKEANR
jgi:2,3-bisphosphoglycerate-dependent phosphoglycerate mutase